MIRLTIISDIRLYREALAKLLDNYRSLRVVGSAFDVASTLCELQRCKPDVILLDMTMVESCEIIDHILHLCPEAKIVALAMSEDEDRILVCAQAGITGYASREASLEQLIQTVHGVMNGELCCPQKITASLFQKLKSLPNSTGTHTDVPVDLQPTSKISLLTHREKQITRLISEGLSNKEIARNLTIEVSTVKNHVHNILAKMDVHSRMQLVTILQQKLYCE